MIFKGLLVAKNCLRPEGRPLKICGNKENIASLCLHRKGCFFVIKDLLLLKHFKVTFPTNNDFTLYKAHDVRYATF